MSFPSQNVIEQLPRIESSDQSTAAQFRSQLERLQRVLLYPLADRLHTPFNSNDLDSHQRIQTLRRVAMTPDPESEGGGGGGGSGKSQQSRLMSVRNPAGLAGHASGKYNTLGRSGFGSGAGGNASGTNLKLLATIDVDAPPASEGAGAVTATSTLPRPAAQRSMRQPKKPLEHSNNSSTAVLENLDIACAGALSASSEALADTQAVMRARPEATEFKKLGFKVAHSTI